jgi:hypothetical protein
MSESMGGIISECPGDFIGIGTFAKAIPCSMPFLACSDPSVLRRILAYISGASFHLKTNERSPPRGAHGAPKGSGPVDFSGAKFAEESESITFKMGVALDHRARSAQWFQAFVRRAANSLALLCKQNFRFRASNTFFSQVKQWVSRDRI